ncbi:MAG: glutamate--tRNA ligase, partial [Phycisphaerales bacterium]
MREAALREKRQYRYDRAAMQIPEAKRAERVAAGEAHVVRLRMPDDESVSVHDEVLGNVSFAPGELDDFIIRKNDGYPTYHFAVVVDDALMGVTHVLRGQEHLNNTPRHVALQQALGFPTPVYAHMPLIFNDKGAKMSKRERDTTVKEIFKRRSVEEVYAELPKGIISAEELREWSGDKKAQLPSKQLDRIADALGVMLPEVSVEDFRKAGYLPEVITNFISLLGWTPSKQASGADREKFDMDFLAQDFDISGIGKSNARFDRNKLLAFNTDVITQLPEKEFNERFAAYCKDYEPDLVERLSGEAFAVLARAVQPQCKTFADAARRCLFAAISAADIGYDEKAVKKNLTRNDAAGLGVLRNFRGALESQEDWSADALSRLVASYCEQYGIGMGMLAQPIRVAVTGTPVSPPIGETLAALGREETLERIERCVRECQRLLAAGV